MHSAYISGIIESNAMSHDSAWRAVYFGGNSRGQCDRGYATGLRDTDESRVFRMYIVGWGEGERRRGSAALADVLSMPLSEV